MFLKPNGAWTADVGKGREFANSIAAVNYCLQEKMHEVYIVLAFDDARLNLRLDPFSVLPPKTGQSVQASL
jgi:hypothetical protein